MPYAVILKSFKRNDYAKKLSCLYVLLLTILSNGCHLGSHEMAMHEPTTRHAKAMSSQNQATALSETEQTRLQKLSSIGNTFKEIYIRKNNIRGGLTRNMTLLHWLVMSKKCSCNPYSLADWRSEDYACDIALLIKSGIDINQQDMGGGSALSIAIWTKEVPIIKALLANPTIDIHKSNSERVIDQAISLCSFDLKMGLEILKIILDKSKDLVDLNNHSLGGTFLDNHPLSPPQVKSLLREHGAKTKQELSVKVILKAKAERW